jgi:hypothetical protein
MVHMETPFMALYKLNFIISQYGRKLELSDNFLWKSPMLHFNKTWVWSTFMALHKLGFVMDQNGWKLEVHDKFQWMSGLRPGIRLQTESTPSTGTSDIHSHISNHIG